MSGNTISTSETRIEAVKLQSSAYGVTIPLIYGVTKVSGNLIWYGGFKAIPHTTEEGGKGGGVKVQNTTYTYTASVMMALGRGQVTNIPRVWRGKKVYTGGITPSQLLTATETYTPPASGAMTYTTAHAADFKAVLYIKYVNVGDGNRTTWLGKGTDFSVTAGVITIVNEFYRSKLLTIGYQYTTGGVSQSALDELGLDFLPGDVAQPMWSGLATAPSNEQLGYSGLAVVAGQDYELGTGAQVENHQFEVVGPLAFQLTGSFSLPYWGGLSVSIPDVDPAAMTRDVLVDAQGGAAFNSSALDDWVDWSDFCVASGLLVSPAITEQVPASDVLDLAARLTATGPVWSDGKLKMVPYADTAVSGLGRTFTPNTTPVYDLDDECYLVSQPGEAPLRVRHKSQSDRYNHVRVQYLNRQNQYNPDVAEAIDQADIDARGRRTMPTLRAHWICEGDIARRVAQLLLQRSLYVCSEYEAVLPWHFALLEPMDLVTLTDARLEFNRLPARIKVIEEDEDGELRCEFEDYPAGQASATLYPNQSGRGFAHDYNVAPGNADAPIIFEAPVERTVNGLALYVAVKGSGANWGGAQVWVSLDGTNYKKMGVVYGSSRAGTLSAAMTSGATSMGVQGLGAQQLISGSAADAAALSTLCYIGGANPEYVSYQTATLTAPGAYTLASLVRGAYRSAAAAHSTGDVFVRVDAKVVKSDDLDISMIARQIWVKLCSFNIYGGGQQSLADVSATTYTITGVMARIPPGDVAGLTATAAKGAVRISWTGNKEKDYAGTELRLGTTWAGSTALRDTKTDFYDWPWPAAGSYTILARHRDRTGNLSTATASVSINVTATGIAITGSDLNVALGGGNLLPNSSFEADSNADGVPDAWGGSSFGTGVTLGRSLVTTRVHGQVGFKLDITALSSPSQSTHLIIQNLADKTTPLTVGASYMLCLAGQVSTLAYKMRIGIQFLDASDVQVTSTTPPASPFVDHTFAAVNSWEREVLPVVVPPGAVSARVRFGIVRPSTGDATLGSLIVDAAMLQMGEVATQYAPAGDEILPGSVGTTQLALASATDTAVAKAAFTAATLASGAPGDVTVTAVSLSYTNDTAATLSVQVEASFYDGYLTNPGAITTKQIYLQQTGAVEGSENPVIQQFNVPPATGNYPGFARAWQWTVAAGATLTCAVKVRVAGSSTSCAVNVDDIVLRVTAIKR